MSKPLSVEFSKLRKIYDLLEKDHECAGTLVVKNNAIKGYTISRGDSDSVHTPLAPWNWHSHPLFLYTRENVSWGWPSGEDLREVIFFGLAGNNAHFVFALEGVYILQITPCFKKWITQEITNQWDRGIVIAVLEMVFKSTHNLRTNSYNAKYPITPQDWINMVRRIRLKFLFSKSKKDPCGKITCSKITTHEGSRNKELMPVEDYAEQYEGNTILVYKVGKKGSINGSKKMQITAALKRLEELAKALDRACPDSRIYNVQFKFNNGIPPRLTKLAATERSKAYKEIKQVKPPGGVVTFNFGGI
tara:strand:+ start:1167 stop:2078 length:912 start_codon:yes stop_codon:yes gene_type:complete